ncbi:MAG: L-2-amino-thiazoline-4-carboxylic acid hydrolase [Clostridiales bacterium]|nr:L-2-amino-thiazoline-4-carboxylic acid hydrolase [Clostridiales bacterium]
MYTYADIKLQNKQDAFSAMFMYVSRSILTLCGVRTGEGIIREAVRRAGRASGRRQLERFQETGVKANLHQLYHSGLDYVEDPRVRSREIFDEEDRQIWEVYTCPLADFWNRHGEGKLGSFYCEEYQYARILAYTEGKGQLNLSNVLTCPRDNFCRFSAYFREANMTPERAKETFAHCDPGYQEPETPENVSFDEGIRNMTISVYCHLLETARERCGQEGVCAVAEGLKHWAAQAIEAMQIQALHTLKPLDAEFVEKNFPLSLDAASDPGCQICSDPVARELMQSLVLTPIAAQKE